MTLKAHAFRNDPRILKAKELIMEALHEHTSHLQFKVLPDPCEIANYHELVENFSKARGANLFYPYLGSGFGSGSLVSSWMEVLNMI